MRTETSSHFVFSIVFFAVSFLEIYNESINDLLVDPKTKAANKKNATGGVCKLQSSKTDEVSVVNLREVSINDHREAFTLLNQGQSQRSQHETALNSDSSRSHSVFTLKLIQSQTGTVWSRLSVVDLAGAERTNRVVHVGKESRMRETVNINQSLLVLGRCLEALKYNQNNPKKLKVVPFRESQITRLFKDSLSGWGRTVMLTNASQNVSDYDETIHALKYAAVAKEIRVVPKVDSIRSATAMSKIGLLSSGLKRRPSQSLQQLDEIEHVVPTLVLPHASSSSSAWDVDDSNPSYDSLLDECFRLKSQIVDLQFAASQTEMNIREELTNQQDELLQEMEEQFFEKMDQERMKLEEKNKRLLELWKLEYIETMNASSHSTSISAANRNSTSDDVITAGLRKELFQAQGEVASLQSTIAANDVLLESTKEMYKESNATVNTLNKRMKALEKELATRVSENEKLTLLLGEAQDEQKKLIEEMTEESAKKDSEWQMKVTQIEQTHQQQLDELRDSQTASSDDQISSLKSQLDEITRTKSELSSQLKDLKKQSDVELKEMKKSHEIELKELKKSHDAELKSLKKQLKESDRSSKEVESTQTELTQLRAQYDQLKSDGTMRETELNQQVTQLHEQLKQVEKEYTKSKSSLEKELSQCQTELHASQEQVTSLEHQLDDLRTPIASSSSSSSHALTALQATQADTLSKVKELKDVKKSLESELKDAKKQREAEVKELKKAHKEEMKMKEAQFERIQTELQEQIHTLESQLSAVVQPIQSTPQSDPLSDTWGSLLSPIKAPNSSPLKEISAPQPVVAAPSRGKRMTKAAAAAAAAAAALPTTTSSAPTSKRSTVAGKKATSRGSSSSAASRAMQVDESFDPFAFDASLVVTSGPNVDNFLSDDDEDGQEEILSLQKKLSEDVDDECQPTSKKRKAAVASTRTGASKKSTTTTVVDKENAPAAANTRSVRPKRAAAAK